MIVLAGDVGGTTTRLGLFESAGGPRAPLALVTYSSREHTDLRSIIARFLADTEATPDAACLAVAGPVVEERAAITNLPWIVDADDLRPFVRSAEVALVNDTVAVAAAVPLLENGEDGDLVTLQHGNESPKAAIAVIAPGTGLGQAFVTRNGSTYRVHPSEGGHADFAPRDDDELGLLRYMRARFGHVSYERVCSGSGLPNIYRYLDEIHAAPAQPSVAHQLAAADDQTPIIVAAATANEPCALCIAAVRTMVSILGAAAGNLVLQVMATGGVYLGGGLSPRLLPFLREGRLLTAMKDKGRQSRLVARVPVHVITQPQAGLIGAAQLGLERLGDRGRAHTRDGSNEARYGGNQ